MIRANLWGLSLRGKFLLWQLLRVMGTIARQVDAIYEKEDQIPGLNVYCHESDDNWPPFDMDLVKADKPFDLYVDFTGPVCILFSVLMYLWIVYC